jgi:hypothetical protein
MELYYTKPSGNRNRINIPNDQIVGTREEFIAKHAPFWAKAHRMPEAVMAEKLGTMWDVAQPPKAEPKPKAAKAEGKAEAKPEAEK